MEAYQRAMVDLNIVISRYVLFLRNCIKAGCIRSSKQKSALIRRCFMVHGLLNLTLIHFETEKVHAGLFRDHYECLFSPLKSNEYRSPSTSNIWTIYHVKVNEQYKTTRSSTMPRSRTLRNSSTI